MLKGKFEDFDHRSSVVLLVNLEGRIAGSEQSLLLLYSHLRKELNIAVACPYPSDLGSILKRLRCRLFKISSPVGKSTYHPRSILNLMHVSFQLMCIVLEIKPVLIHSNNLKAALLSIPAVLLSRTKFVWHGRDLSGPSLAMKLCSLLCQKVIAVSDSVKDFLIRQGVDKSKIEVIHNGTNIKEFLRKKSLFASKELVFANIGQYVPWKKQYLFIEAAQRFIEQGGKGRFLLIGDDVFGRDIAYKELLLHQISKSCISKYIECLNWRCDAEQIWGQIDCLVHTAENEPFGRVIIEAMAHKIPVVAVDSGGPSEIMKHGETGLLAKPNDAEGICQAMLAIAGDGRLATDLALAGYNHAVNHFSASKTAESVKLIYQRILAA
jgi:glycosyltransferase involved in cell wall biosynthesis